MVTPSLVSVAGQVSVSHPDLYVSAVEFGPRAAGDLFYLIGV
mgnify:FL=1